MDLGVIFMKQQSCLKDFARYTSLSVLGTLGVSCYILADTFFIAKGLGAGGLTALNLAIPMYNFIYGIGLMLGMGGATKFAICKSQGHQEQIDRVYTHAILLALLSSIVFFLLGVFASKPLALLLGANASVLAMTDIYLKWMLLFAPAFILNNVLLCFVRNDGSPHLSMAAMLIGSFSNIILDYIFIFPMQMGMFGAIFATGMSPVISIVIMLSHWVQKKNSFHLVRIRPSLSIIRQEVSLGFPTLVAQVSSGIVMVVFNMLILGLEGNTGVAAYGIVANIAIVMVSIYNGISQGIQPLLSTFHGQKDKRQIGVVLRYAMITMLVISVGVYLFIFLFASPIAAVFNSEHSPKLQQIAVTGLRLYFTALVFVGYNTILATYFTSVEKPLPAHVLSLLKGFALIIPLSFLLSACFGMTGIWLTYPITEGLASLLGFVLYKRQKRSSS